MMVQSSDAVRELPNVYGKMLMGEFCVEIHLSFSCIHIAANSKSSFFIFASLLASVLLDLAEALIRKWLCYPHRHR